MIRMVCEDCRTVYYSAAARTMVAQGERCSKCGGRLLLDEAQDGEPVGAGNGQGTGKEE